MGANASAPVKPTFTYASPSSSEDEELVSKLHNLILNQPSESDDYQDLGVESADESNPITVQNLNKWEAELLSDPKNQLALNCFTGNDITQIIANTTNQNKNNIDLFNNLVKFEGGPITNQKSSGRCWLFASTNVFKEFIKAKYNLESFEFSQNYLYFYDKLEKSNWFLNRILDSYEEDIDSRLVQYLVGLPENDGGQWDMVVNLVTHFGLVPKTVFEEERKI
ncbi:unnamed protein product [Ambrosiozyma monospora]|uniref:Cysteine proteinase 1, mitochondrial n=1 Tax=Ambrosiozyma monospora TaxID=43982 RepID=A0A9W7DPC9_AMBMO|nr:unnamed protein product [Ambrosiozyma monospora]